MRKKAELIIMALLLTALLAVGKHLESFVSSDTVETDKAVIVVDCGHGEHRLRQFKRKADIP